MNSSAQYSNDAPAPPSNRIDVMMISEDDSTSRDSGVCEMMDEDTPTCFSSLSTTTTTTTTTYQIDSMEFEESVENCAPRANTSRFESRTLIRREKSSCQVRLFDESPTSRTLFARPSALAFRHSNFSRKRPGDKYNFPAKMEKLSERASDHYHLEQMEFDDEESPMDTVIDRIMDSLASNTHQSTSKSNFAVPKGLKLTRSYTTSCMPKDDDDACVELDAGHLIVHYSLKTIGKQCSTTFRRITAETLIALMLGNELEFNEKFILVDCRYPFEYAAGHIQNSVNFFDRETVGNFFYGKNETERVKKIPIFYCEFSQKRGPSMAYSLRQIDRHRNMHKYPNCDFEEMYVLDKGYRNFFRIAKQRKQTNLCFPPNYVEMCDKRFAHELKKWNYHRRAAPGQTCLRPDAASVLVRSTRSSSSFFGTVSSNSAAIVSKSSSEEVTVVAETSTNTVAPTVVVSAPSDENSQNNTPGVPRTNSTVRRHLFGNATSSPTNFGLSPPKNCPEKKLSPLKPLLWS